MDRTHPRAGGAEIHLHEVFGRLARRGHRITLLVSGWDEAEPEEMVDGMRVVRTGRRYTFPVYAWLTYFTRLRRERFDLVVEDLNKFPLFTPWWSDAPVVTQLHHLFGRVAFRQESVPVAAAAWLGERLIPHVYGGTRVHAVSESTARELVDMGLGRERIRVIPNGVDHEYLHPDPGSERFREPTFVYVGRLVRYKELEVLLAAVARLADRDLRVRLLLAGKGEDRPRLEAVARELGLSERVEFLGWVPDDRKRTLLRRAWATVYPSPKEGWGITTVESAACGTPVVASDSPGLRDSVADGTSGLLVPHADAGAWADAMASIVRDRELRERLARGAVEHARRFSWDRTARETESDLLEIVDVERGGDPDADNHRGATLRRE